MSAGAVHATLALGGGPTPGAVTTGEAPFFQERSFALAGRNQQPEADRLKAMNQFDAEFQEFWDAYPRHVKKMATRKAYEKARRVASAATILAGAMLYARTCPHEEQFIAHPTSWLNAGRWDDEIGSVRRVAVNAQRDWFEECAELHAGECGLNRWRHHERMEIEAIKRAMGK